MKIIKIENGKGLFVNPSKLKGVLTDDSYVGIEKIERDDVLDIITYIIDNDFDVDEIKDDNSIHNPVQKIIYENIYAKLLEIKTNKEEIKKTVDNRFKEAEEKYN